MERPLISFVVPIYKTEKYLKQCVESILAQTYQKIELILVDDGSPDGCPMICDSYQNKDERVRVIHQQNAGLSEARNAGIARSSGEWVCFVDSDDWIEPDMCEAALAGLGTEADLCILGLRHMKNGNPVMLKKETGLCKVLGRNEFIELEKSLLNRYCFNEFRECNLYAVSACAKFYRYDFLKRFNLRFQYCVCGEDLYFNTQCFCLAKSGIWYDKIAYNYRKEGESITSRYHETLPRNFKDILLEIRIFLEEKGIYEQVKAEYDARVLSSFMFCVIQCFCHQDNPSSYRQRKKGFYYFRNEEPYAMGIQAATVSTFPLMKKGMCILIKRRLFLLLNFIVYWAHKRSYGR